MISRSPVYNLNAVLKETGLKADVLRAWERRYELPVPQRTPGGHRLYSDYDIETIKWLRERQAEGLSISRAVELWHSIINANRDPLEGGWTEGHRPSAGHFSPAGDRIDSLRQKWLVACKAFDGEQADDILNQAFAIYPVETVCTEILQQGLREIGNEWYHDQASVQQEHFASVLAGRRLETLISAAPRPTRRQVILIGCPSGEAHTFPALLLSLLLLRRGLKVVYLGADIPVEQLSETAAAIRPDLVIQVAQQLTTAAALRVAVRSLREQGNLVAYGGLIFNRMVELRQDIPACYLGETLEGAIQVIEQLIVSPAPLSGLDEVDNPYIDLARQYREKRPLIEMGLSEKLHEDGLPLEYIHEINLNFGNGLSAALEFGNPALMEADLDWVKKLLASRRISSEVLMPYLSAYAHSIDRELGDAGVQITAWISDYIARAS